MDTTDLKIINHLKSHGRAPIKEISSVVNLSSPAVTERMKRLEETGVIKGYQAEIDYTKLGKAIQAFVAVDVEPKKYETLFLQKQSPPLTGCRWGGTSRPAAVAGWRRGTGARARPGR